jgi:hypothetical protein
MNVKKLFNGIVTPTHLSNDWIKIAYEHKLFKLFLPHDLGGLGMKFSDTLPILQSCAYMNGSLGWLIQIGNGGNVFAAYMNKKVTQQLFAPQHAVLAGSGAVSGSAIQTEGGYLVSGKWQYCSGADFATFFTANCKTESTDEVLSVVLFSHQIHIEQDWNSWGLAHTCTHTIVADNVFVEDAFTFNLSVIKNKLPGEVFGLPFIAFAQLYFIQTVYGIYARLLVELNQIISDKTEAPRWTSLHHHIQKLTQELEVFSAITNTYARQLESMEPDSCLVNAIDECCKQQVSTIRNHAQNLLVNTGMVMLQKNEPAAGCYLDLMAAMQHGLLNNYEV